jgi:hypothetical protein
MDVEVNRGEQDSPDSDQQINGLERLLEKMQIRIHKSIKAANLGPGMAGNEQHFHVGSGFHNALCEFTTILVR